MRQYERAPRTDTEPLGEIQAFAEDAWRKFQRAGERGRAVAIINRSAAGNTTASELERNIEQINRALGDIKEAASAIRQMRGAMESRLKVYKDRRRYGKKDEQKRKRGEDPYKRDAHKMLSDTGANSMRQPGTKE